MLQSFSELTRIVVAVDPAVTANEESDDTGIVVVARGPHQSSTCEIASCPGHGYVLEDASCHMVATEWAKLVVSVYDKWKADRIVAEVNNGGDMVGALIHAVRAGVPYAKVTATRGKQMRAEPIAALYEQGRVHHLGDFPELKEQQETWTPDSKWSPDRLDALVWGLTYLGLVGGTGHGFATAWREIASRRGRPEIAELRQIPKLQHDETIHKWAEEKCKDGENHRFFEMDGEYRCPKCEGFLKQ